MSKLTRGPVLAEQTDAFAAVSTILWSEREALELLLFKLVEEQLVVTSGSPRWLSRADAEVRAALDRMRAGEVVRAAEVEALAMSLGLPVETSLAELAAAAPEPWDLVLTEHRNALRELVLEIEAVSAENRRLLDAGAKAVRETLDSLGLHVAGYGPGYEGGYTASGAAANVRRGPFLLDEHV